MSIAPSGERGPGGPLAWSPYALGLVGLVLVLVATAPLGAFVTTDSISYFSVADHLERGEGFTLFDGRPYTAWPPLLPLLMWLGKLVGLESATTGRWLNALAFAAIVAVATRWLLATLRSRLLALLGGLALLFGYSLFKTALHIWTEPLYVLLTLLFLLTLFRARDGLGRGGLLLLAFLAALAWLTRYIGVTLVAAGGLVLLLTGPGSAGARLGRAVFFGILASVLPAAFIVRNLALTGAPAGERSPSSFGFVESLGFTLKTFGWWLFPERLGPWLPAAGFLAIAAAVILLGLRARRADSPAAFPRRVMLLAGGIYLAFLLFTSTRFAFEAIHSRYLIPLHFMLLLGALTILDEWIDSRRGPVARTLPWLIALWLLYPVAQTAVYVKQARGTEPSAARALWLQGKYNLPDWDGCELIGLLRATSPAGRLVSNEPEALYYLTGLSAERSPRRTYHVTSRTPTPELERFADKLGGADPVLLVWFDPVPPHGQRGNYHDLNEIRAVYDLEQQVRVADGGLYRPRHAAAGAVR